MTDKSDAVSHFVYQNTEFQIMGYNERDHIFRKIEENQTFYEIDLLEFMRNVSKKRGHTKKKTCAIDIGANIGNHSIYIGKYVSDHVISFEPNPLVLPILDRNLNKNLDNFTVYDVGVGDKETSASISLSSNYEENIGMAKLDLSNEANRELKVLTLDSVISSWLEVNPDFLISSIKIDVEGMEPNVLKGSLHTIDQHKPELFIEAENKQRLVALTEILLPLGYKKLSRWASTPMYHFSFKPSLNLKIWSIQQSILRRIKKKVGLYR